MYLPYELNDDGFVQDAFEGGVTVDCYTPESVQVLAQIPNDKFTFPSNCAIGMVNLSVQGKDAS